MGLYIKGFTIPENGCNHCFFRDGNYCHLTNTCVVHHAQKDQRSPDCPLVEVPSHGRLVDEEALAQDAYRRMLECEKYKRPDEKPYEVLRAIELAPTIIPAEEDTNGE